MHFTEKKSMIYDLLKAFAILAVIAGHCLAMFTPDGAIPTVCGSRLLGLLGSIVYRFHIPCLFVVSGALFAFCWRKGHYHDPRLFLRKKALRLLVPYFWCCSCFPHFGDLRTLGAKGRFFLFAASIGRRSIPAPLVCILSFCGLLLFLALYAAI